MKSFTFTQTLSTEPVANNSTAISWLFPSLFLVILLVSYFFHNEINYVALIFLASYTTRLFYKPSPSNSAAYFGETTLEFGKKNLLYKNGDTIIWHIPYERLKKIQIIQRGRGTFFSPATKEVLILTNDNDSYSLIGTVPDHEVEEIQKEIEMAKSKFI
jgi:hypothetical protein